MNVHLVTLGCARNEVDSEELAARLADGGFRLVDDPEDADAVMVNTCGFIEQAKKDSVDTLMEAADLKDSGRAKAVVAVGCMAERYGNELAQAMPEADAVFGFDDYATIADKLSAILHGGHHEAHVPRDRRQLLPITPIDRAAAATAVSVPGHHTDLPAGLAPASGPRTLRRRLGNAPHAPLKIASGCDRRCTFCAIPRFRGSYLSRPADEVVEEARWLVDHGVKEAFLVSENSSSYGKDLGDMRALEKLLVDLSAIDGLEWIRVSYLQPAELRPSLVKAMLATEKVVPYFDLSFQHASAPLLRRMRRFGDAESFLNIVDQIRYAAPTAGIRSNFIVGFPGETEDDLETLRQFVQAARLDVVGIFGYSDEDDTEAKGLDGHLDEDEVAARAAELSDLTAELCAQRAEDRIGEVVTVLVEGHEDGDPVGRAAHQGPDVDGVTTLLGMSAEVGDFVVAAVTQNDGVDLIAEELDR
ncbi:30S ribosomal protein S12 methylthiotransferase RimO [Aestuariimicrobium ganziense]|uniref:30S ribosomal protein S12 methylthiotransferase RimO n=1 Tax=Aestuariimicrobium ganziense TaxID=2773677 RepID=UPI0019412D6A|nr:30S ribosomal protein S12 methylthiotransferase RimO [Aestuariimicrobium ganziense]